VAIHGPCLDFAMVLERVNVIFLLTASKAATAKFPCQTPTNQCKVPSTPNNILTFFLVLSLFPTLQTISQ
jgi:hypothetical protein